MKTQFEHHHPDFIRRIVERWPDRLCVVEAERRLTFAQVDDRANRAAGAFRDAGLATGGRVAVLAKNEIEYLEIQFACQRGGLVLVPLNYRLSRADLQAILDDCTPELLIYSSDFVEMAESLEVPRIWHMAGSDENDGYGARIGAAAAIRREIEDPDADALLMYTSGTTGRAKGVRVTNRIQLARSVALALEVAPRAGDVYLQVAPMFHQAQTFSYSFAMAGAPNIMVKDFVPTEVLALIEAHGVTHSLLVPTMISMMTREPTMSSTDLSSLRCLFYGSSPIPAPELLKALEAFGCDFLQIYGMTETGPATSLRPEHHDPVARPDLLRSAGRVVPTFEVSVVDSLGHAVPRGDVGEVLIAGPGVMSGYWNMPEDTRTALEGGAMHTGDVGYLDDQAFLFITDRLKDIIISGGENVSSTEVESVVSGHSSVRECAVVGIRDDILGERVHAVVVLESGSELDETSILEFCRADLSGFKRPRSVSVVDALPRNALGKVQKNLLRAQLNTAST